MNYGQQLPTYNSYMREKLAKAQYDADIEYYNLINGRQPQSPMQQSPVPQAQEPNNKNAYSVVVANETAAENYPVNTSLDDMFFICGDSIYLKTYDLGKGKWNDIKKYTLAMETTKTELSKNYDDDIAELRKQIIALEKKIKPPPSTKPQKAVAKVIEKVVADDDEAEYEEVIIKKTPIKKK